MEQTLMFWIFKKHGRKRGYILNTDEWKQFIPYSDREMKKKLIAWQKDLKQVAGSKAPQTN